MHKVTHDSACGRFLVDLEQGLQATVQYKQNEKIVTITSTRIPEELQGRGFGKVMMESVLAEIERLGLTVIPECSYVIHYMNKQTQWSHLLQK